MDKWRAQVSTDLATLVGLLLVMTLTIWVHYVPVLLTTSGMMSSRSQLIMRIIVTVLATLFTSLVKSRLQHGLLRRLESRLRGVRGFIEEQSSSCEKRRDTLRLELRSIDRQWRGALSIDTLSGKTKNVYPFLVYLFCGLITPAIVATFSPTSVQHQISYSPIIADSSMFGNSEFINGSLMPCVGVVESGEEDWSNLYWPLGNHSSFYGATTDCPPSKTMAMAPNINSDSPDDYVYSDAGVAIVREAIGAPASIYDGSALYELATKYGTALQRTTQCVPVMSTNPVRCDAGGNVTVLRLDPDPTLHIQVFGPYGQYPNNIYTMTSVFPSRNFTKDSGMLSFLYAISDTLHLADTVGTSILGFGAYTDPAGKTAFASRLAGTINDPDRTVGLAGNSTYAITCTIQPRNSFEYRRVTLDLQGVAQTNNSNLAWRLTGGEECTPVNETISNVHFITAAISAVDQTMERESLDGFIATLIDAACDNRGPPHAFPNSRNALEDTLGLIAAMGVSQIPISDSAGVVADATEGGGGPASAVIEVTRMGGDTGLVLLFLIPHLASFLVLAALFFLSFRIEWRIGGSKYKGMPADECPTKYAAESICELVTLGQPHGLVSVSEQGSDEYGSQYSAPPIMHPKASMKSHLS